MIYSLFRWLYKQFDWLARSMSRFGLAWGLYMFLRKLICTGEASIPLKGYNGPVRIRRKSSDEAVFKQVFLKDYYEFRELPSSPELIIDAGANIGCTTVYFAQRFPNALVVAIEPNPSNYTLLRRNTQNYDNVKTLNVALWGTNSKVAIVDEEARELSFRYTDQLSSEEAGSEKVEGLTVSDVQERLGNREIDVLKMDIEGAEREVFGGDDLGWVNDVKVFIIEFHEHYAPGCSWVFYSAIGDRKFRQIVKEEHCCVVME